MYCVGYRAPFGTHAPVSLWVQDLFCIRGLGDDCFIEESWVVFTRHRMEENRPKLGKDDLNLSNQKRTFSLAKRFSTVCTHEYDLKLSLMDCGGAGLQSP